MQKKATFTSNQQATQEEFIKSKISMLKIITFVYQNKFVNLKGAAQLNYKDGIEQVINETSTMKKKDPNNVSQKQQALQVQGTKQDD